mmetsp:Transcript_91526/g.261534  ORF Transcript_91526/g.261534 Transcript_91526/m.261534 type:complete len:87 (-) Transcript_91526:473-733(-)
MLCEVLAKAPTEPQAWTATLRIALTTAIGEGDKDLRVPSLKVALDKGAHGCTTLLTVLHTPRDRRQWWQWFSGSGIAILRYCRRTL